MFHGDPQSHQLWARSYSSFSDDPLEAIAKNGDDGGITLEDGGVALRELLSLLRVTMDAKGSTADAITAREHAATVVCF